MSLKIKSKIPDRNRSPYGWWIASYLERAVWDKKRNTDRNLVWENTIVLKVRDREAAYKKAIKLGKANHSTFWNEKTGETGCWEFLGLTMLLPIYEPLEDGAEVIWNDHGYRGSKFITSIVKSKKQLCVFIDSDAV